MNRTETIQILSVLRSAYPTFYKDLRKNDLTGIVDLWATMFHDDDFKVVAAAVKAHIACDTKGFPPVIGAIKESMSKLANGDTMTEAEAWGLVRKALGNGVYGAEKEFRKLPQMIQRLVGSPNQLREWAIMNSDEVESVVASNFQRSYRARVSSEKEYMKLPEDLKQVFGQIGDGMRLSLDTE